MRLSVGFAAQVIGRLLMLSGVSPCREWGGYVMYGGLTVFTVGCIAYTRGKGRCGVWGLLGMFSLPGLVALFFLPTQEYVKRPLVKPRRRPFWAAAPAARPADCLALGERARVKRSAHIKDHWR